MQLQGALLALREFWRQIVLSRWSFNARLTDVTLRHQQKHNASRTTQKRPDKSQHMLVKRALAQSKSEQRSAHHQQSDSVDDKEPAGHGFS